MARRDSIIKHQNDPCATCKKNSRAPGRTQCLACKRDCNKKSKKRCQDSPCARCNINVRTGNYNYCIECTRIMLEESRTRVEKLPCVRCKNAPRDGDSAHCNKCRGIIDRGYKMKIKEEVFANYGVACYCCSEQDIRFLTLGHAFNNGAAERKEMKSKGGFHFYLQVRKMGYPKDRGYRIECYDCNMGAAANGGVCPHQEDKMKLKLVSGI